MDPAKVQTIQDWPKPHKVKDIQFFLGFANFYCRFISNYSDTVVPLTRLTCKGVLQSFSDAARKSFSFLKSASPPHPFSPTGSPTNGSLLRQMLLITIQELSFLQLWILVKFTLLLFIPAHFLHPNSTTTLTIKNCQPSLKLSVYGDTILKVLVSQLMFLQITRIRSTFLPQKCLPADKLVNPNTLLSSTSQFFSALENQEPNLTHSLDAGKSTQMGEIVTMLQ